MKKIIYNKVHLETTNQLFASVMSNDKKYIIPRFQRDYSWHQDEWQELWTDIEQMQQSHTQHFMGYLVLQSDDDKTFKIIDGQQRLTTISLIVLGALGRLKSLVEKGQDKNDNQQRLDNFQRTYIGVLDPVTLQTSPKLRLNRHNDQHFRSLASGLCITAKRNVARTNRAINEGFDFFSKKFASSTGRQIAETISNIADGLLFTTITVDDEMNAYTLFETLNSRGVHLSTPDLLKNYLLSTMANDAQFLDEHFDNFEESWAAIIEQLGETEFTSFLRSHWGMENSLPHKRELYKTLKNKINRADLVMPYLRALEKMAPLYAALQMPYDSFWIDTRGGKYSDAIQHLEALKLFNIKTPLSLMMAGFENFAPPEFITFLKRIVIITMRYNVICKRSPNEQEQLYNKVANLLMRDRLLLTEVTSQLHTVYPHDEEVRQRFKDQSMPSRRSGKRILFILREIERHLSGEVPGDSLTLEHILPYSPSASWQEDFGREYVERAIDRLGNMALLSTQQNLGQEFFVEKQKALRDSPYKINRHIAASGEWNISTLQGHQRWLAKQAVATWNIPSLSKK